MTERITAAEFRQVTKTNKYRNKPTVVDGIRFQSKREADRWLVLCEQLKRGEISHLERQPVFKLAIGDRPILIRSNRYPNGRQAKYVADFAYFNGDYRVIEDAKGHRTRDFILKKAVVEAMFPAVKVVEI